jgi:endonuclease-8
MPEGDTVWLAARRLNAALAGRRLLRGELRVPRLATVTLAGAGVREVVARGKHLLFRLDDGRSLHTHFMMEGAFHLYRPGAPWRGGPAFQVRVVLATAEIVAVGYRLGVVELVPTAGEADAVGPLGPDVLGADWDLDAALANLLARPRRQVGAALLDQRVLAGLGNIWRTEACFLAGVSPWTPVADVADPRRLVEIGARLVAANAGRPEQISTGSRRRGERHWVYGRAGRPCRRCGTMIRRAEQDHDAGEPPAAAPGRRIATGATRSTAWCPRCQPGPGPSPGSGPGPDPAQR